MCGIVGEITFDGSTTEAWVHTASDMMAHRGPDGDGFYCDGTVAFGHRRLSIIDLAGGVQPMSYADGRYWITYNGEVYNFRDLRAELEALGHVFETNSDTEVILAAYAAWGLESFVRLNGIFAFGLWDTQERELILARDHLGVKPMLYHHDQEGLRFGSELKGLLAHARVARAVDSEALRDYLELGYVLAPKTIIQDVYKLPPAHWLRVRADGQMTVQSYWDLAAVAQNPALDISEAEHLTRFDALLNETVDQQMVSDVPLGAFLSGGIDSSAVSCYAAARIPDPLKTFSIGFEEASFSELDYAQLAADHLHTDHYQRVQHPLSMDALRDLVWYYDEPLGDTSLIPTYLVSKVAREQVTVTLSGDGGDELLAGYDTYVADRFQRIYARVPRWMHEHVFLPAVNLIPASNRKLAPDELIKRFITQAHGSAESAHYGWRLMFDSGESRDLLGASSVNGYTPFAVYARYYEDVSQAGALARDQYVDIKTWLVDDILTKVDRASMANSLEARVPFLAPPVVEYAMQLPARLKLRGLNRKYILKATMRGRLPDTVLDRRKRGFNAPVSLWMRGAWREPINELFAKNASTLVDLRSPTLQTLWQDHVAGRADHGFKLWTLLSLLLWEQRVLHGD